MDITGEAQNVEVSGEEMNMEQLLGPETHLEEGKIFKVKVAGKTEDGLMVDLGIKAEGLVKKEEFTPEQFAAINAGDELTVYIIKLHTPEGYPLVSHKKAKEIASSEKINASFRAGLPVEGQITKKIKGGYTVDIGMEAFLPASQLDVYQVKDVSKYLGIKMKFMVTDMERGGGNLVVSRRKLLEIEQKEARKKVFDVLEEGQTMEGIVSRIVDFGAFIDIGGMDGFVHISDLAWHRVGKVEDVLSEHQSVTVKVLKIDKEKEKVNLGIKQLFPRPWDNVKNKYKEGDILKCKITSVTEFGMFAQLEPGLEGLVHLSELAWNDPKGHTLKNYKAGQELELKIIQIDLAAEKLSLSLKKTKPSPWDEAKNLYPSGTKVKGSVTSLVPFGAFVKLPSGIEGLIHVSDMSWLKKISHPSEVLKSGQEIEVMVLDVNTKEERISLSLKRLAENPFAKYAPGKIVTGKVKRVSDFGAFVELEPNLDALVRIGDMSVRKIAHPSEVLKTGDTVEAKVIKCDEKERKIDISMKKLEAEREKELLKKYVNKVDRPTLGDILQSNDEE